MVLRQADSHQLLTAEAQIPSQDCSCGIRGGQRSTKTHFSSSFGFSSLISFHHCIILICVLSETWKFHQPHFYRDIVSCHYNNNNSTTVTHSQLNRTSAVINSQQRLNSCRCCIIPHQHYMV